MRPPDLCTSLNCRGPLSDTGHCPKCSHARYSGEGRDLHGKLWRWEFSPQYGPVFVGARGEPLARQPAGERHRAWQAWEPWYRELCNGNLDGEA